MKKNNYILISSIIISISLMFIIYIILKPKMVLVGNKHITLTINDQYVELGAKAKYFDKDISNQIEIKGEVDTNKIGTYIVTYLVQNAFFVSKINRVITIIDDPPVRDSTIYLTFDDGPSSFTTELLDLLKKEKIKATFFVLNWSDKYDKVMKRTVKEGHAIGLHAYKHDYYNNYRSVNAFFTDLTLIHDKVKEVTGVDSKIIRFIGGSSNTVSRYSPGIMTKLTKEVEKRGFYYFDWNIGSGDTYWISSNSVYRNVIRELDDKSTYIVLMHDWDYNEKIIPALKNIIKYAKDKGYFFDKITTKTPPIKHQVSN